MEEKNNELIPPDYYGHPEDDDPLEEIIDDTDDDARIEKILNDEAVDKQVQEQKRKEESIKMADAPFTPQFGQSTFGSGSVGGNNSGLPWEQSKPQQQTTTWGGGTWGNGGRGFSTPGQQRPWGTTTQQPIIQQQPGNGNAQVNSKLKRIVICDALDCLVESYDSAGKPGVIPRALWDLKPRFDVWEKIRSFNPTRIYIIFPNYDLIPSLGGKDSTDLALAYIRRSLSAYLRIPEIDCSILRQMQYHTPKSKILSSVIGNGGNPDEIVYIGIYSGKYGLSDGDIQAAHQVGMDYIDIFNLLQGYYIYE
jgi:hypothetical protein